MVQILPQFDPWGQAGQQIGGGIGNYLMQQTDRNRLQQGLSAAQALFQPEYDRNGQLIPKNPGQQAVGLLSALAGTPGGLQAGSDILPYLMKEYNRQAYLNTPKNLPTQSQNRGEGDPLRPQGGVGGAPSVQFDADESGGNLGPTGQYDQPVKERQRFPQTVDENEEQNLGSIMPVDLQGPIPQLQVYGPEERARDTQNFLASGGDPDLLHQHLEAQARGIENANNALLKSQELEQAKVEARRSLSNEQDEFLYGDKGQFARLGWTDPQTQRIGTANFLRERAKVDKQGLPQKETNRKAWNAAEKQTQRYLDARQAMVSPTGRRRFGYQNQFNADKEQTQRFLETIPNGHKDLDAINEAIALQQEANYYIYEEAAEMATPTSQKTIDVIHNAPNLRLTSARGSLGEVSKNDPHMQRAYTDVAAALTQGGMPEWDNLTVLRRQLHEQKGWDAEDFNRMYEKMKAMGFKPSPYQAQNPLNQEIVISMPEIWDNFLNLFMKESENRGGRSTSRLFKTPGRL